MNPTDLLNHFDRITDAPEAIPNLRRFILDLATHGKLTQQCGRDEPATNLLRRNSTETASLIRNGSLKSPPIAAINDEIVADWNIPKGWAVATLGSVAQKITDGAHKTPTYVSKGVPFVSVKDFSDGALTLEATRLIPPEEHAILYKRCDPRRGDILIGRIGTLGRAVLVETDIEFSLFVSVGLIRFSHDFFSPRFIRLLLNSPQVEREFDRIKVGGGTHTNKLNLSDLRTVHLLIPPLGEQHRIVAKVDELMALCDRLEAALQERESLRRKLLDSLIYHTVSAPKWPKTEE